MAPGTAATASSLESYLSQYPSIKLFTPASSDYEALRECFVVRPAKPFAIARPQTAEDVQALIRFCIKNDVDFNIRTGGHDCAGRSQIPDVLMIDMRDIDYVKVDESKTTARVGGGILTRGLTKALGEHGLITPTGTMATVGYVGWCTLGGYGPFSSLHGLGVDQIVGAKLVDPKGEIVDADAELLKGIRGGGGIFGAIVELTVKVYPLKELLTAFILYDSSDMKAAWTSYTEGVEKLSSEEGLPPALQLQTFAFDLPNIGKALAIAGSWADADHEEGRRWFDKVAGLGKCMVNQTGTASLLQYVEDNEKLMPSRVHGKMYAVNLRRWAPRSVGILAKHSLLLPVPGTAISIHTLRAPRPNEDSVFGSRTEHHMVEMIGLTADPGSAEAGSLWGQALRRELREEDPGNVLDGVYVSLSHDEDGDVERIYGSRYQTLLGLKRKYDPENVFKYAVPRLAI